MGSNFPAHLSLTDKTAFILWAESYPYNEESLEIKALSFLPDYIHVATKTIAWVLWSMVYILKGGSLPCPDGLACGLHMVDPILQQPPESIFPVQINFDEDLRNRARERWEETLSWIQYWWEAGYMSRNPMLFYSRNLRMNSPMVLFILYHINKVLPEDRCCKRQIQQKSTIGKDIRRKGDRNRQTWHSMPTTVGRARNTQLPQWWLRCVTRR